MIFFELLHSDKVNISSNAVDIDSLCEYAMVNYHKYNI